MPISLIAHQSNQFDFLVRSLQ